MMVVEQDGKDALLQAMADVFARRILTSTMLRAKSVEEIAKENGIPISSCYRRVRELVNLKLLRIERIIITGEGKKFETFRSTVKDAKVTFSSDEITVEITPIAREPAERLSSMWRSVRGVPQVQVVSPVG